MAEGFQLTSSSPSVQLTYLLLQPRNLVGFLNAFVCFFHELAGSFSYGSFNEVNLIAILGIQIVHIKVYS